MAYRIINTQTKESIDLDKAFYRVGRSRHCDILIEDKYTSRYHASLKNEGDCVVVRDNDSSNGTYLNGMKISGMAVLEPSDKLVFGKCEFEFTDNDMSLFANKSKNALRKWFKIG